MDTVKFKPYAEHGDYIYGTVKLHSNQMPEFAYLAGGYALAVITGITAGDIDIWLPQGYSWEPEGYTLGFESDWAKTYVHTKYPWITKLQVIKTVVNSPLEVIQAFDISLAKVVIYDGCQAIIHRDIYNHVFFGLTHATCQNHNIKRMVKYARKFGVSLREMFDDHDLAMAGLQDGWTDADLQNVLAEVMEQTDYDDLEHLAGLRPAPDTQ